MKAIILTLAASLTISFFNICSSLSQNSLEQQFLDLENKWMNAWNKDEKTAKEILSDNFTLTSSLSTGELMTKEQWIGTLSRFDCKNFQFDKIKVRKYGNTAVVNSWYHQEAIANGKEWNGKFLMTAVWVKKMKNGRLFQDMQVDCNSNS